MLIGGTMPGDMQEWRWVGSLSADRATSADRGDHAWGHAGMEVGGVTIS